MKVVIFCGGQGLRMGDTSASIPKPMVPIGERPILWHIMKYFAHFGHTDFILCLGYKAEVIKDYFLNYNEALSNDFVLSEGGRKIELLRSDIDEWRITFVDTGMNSSVGQRLRAVAHLVEDDVFLATYGDGVTDAPLPELISAFHARERLVSFLAIRPKSYSFHTVRLADGNLVTGFTDITQADIWINGGFFVLHRDAIDYIHDGEDFVGPALQRLIDVEQVAAFPYTGFWAPMDTLKDKHNLEALAEAGRPPWAVWHADGVAASHAPA
jgi:glucose-1-phosphate cytidylyltransferase